MLSIRLQRVGRKKAPTYRVVVMPKERDPYGKVVEILGHYNPRSNPKELVLKEDRVKHWLGEGAQPSETVHNLLVSENLLSEKKVTASHISKKRAGKMAEKEAEAKEKAEAEAAAKAEAEAAKKAEEAAANAEEEKKEEAPAEEPKEEEKKETAE